MQVQRVALLFGGPSPEHEVSLASARTVLQHFPKKNYTATPIYLDRRGDLWLSADIPPTPPARPLPEGTRLLPDRGGFFQPATRRHIPFDTVFPVLHGDFGEDGALQGLLRYIGLPYVGCGVAASAIAMDKLLLKQILSPDVSTLPALPVAPVDSNTDTAHENTADLPPTADAVFSALGKTLFVKPTRGGSSVGAAIVRTPEEFSSAVRNAAQYGAVMAEPYLPAREIEVALLEERDTVIASLPGEVIPGAPFYSYSDKYEDKKATTVVRADLSPDVAACIRSIAVRAFRRIGGTGLARVDFFLTNEGKIYLNEINTLPGFTGESLYPRMMMSRLGCDFPTLLSRLLESARITP